MKLEVGVYKDSESPYRLIIELVGLFHVDEDSFPVNKIEHFARNNAPLLLSPYLRESAYSLTTKCGFTPFILPLYEVPQFRIEDPLHHESNGSQTRHEIGPEPEPHLDQ